MAQIFGKVMLGVVSFKPHLEVEDCLRQYESLDRRGLITFHI